MHIFKSLISFKMQGKPSRLALIMYFFFCDPQLGLCSFSDRKKRGREGKRQKNCERLQKKREISSGQFIFSM